MEEEDIFVLAEIGLSCPFGGSRGPAVVPGACQGWLGLKMERRASGVEWVEMRPSSDGLE